MECKNTGRSPLYYYISKSRHRQAVIFIHAAFADHTEFDPQIEVFSKYFTVITVDLIGHGLSTKTKKGDGIEHTSEYLKDILSAENIEKAHFVGVSIGAVLAQDFANKFPDSVLSLSCFGGYDINNFDPAIQKKNSGAQRAMMLKALFSIKWFAKSNKLISAYTPKAQEAFYRMNIRFPRKSLIYLAGLNELINRNQTGQRAYPLMIGCGDKDLPMELTIVEKWHEAEPNSKLVVFKNSGHLVNMDAPDEFNKVVLDFMLTPKRS